MKSSYAPFNVFLMGHIAQFILMLHLNAMFMVSRLRLAYPSALTEEVVAAEIAVFGAGEKGGVDVVLAGGAEVREDEGGVEVEVVVSD